ncbi:LrgB family protein [Alteromonas sp. C1M14]|uniref:LrgB family protein n=1 Tax=Alteromonas sp. C1M14 TaxID=2841567 RepID=UPI001C09766C|nr:LrgB family protein [Alteromonas sp. C1M14]MBU2977790.1 LrgB family protein [Alteromonas sp. C1M14]
MTTNIVQPFVEKTTDLFFSVFSVSGAVWIGITLCAYLFSLWVVRKTNNNPFANPVLVTAIITGAAILLSQREMSAYQQDTAIIHWLLGPATVALALPMYAQWEKIRSLGWRLVAAVATGGIIAPVTAWLAVYAFDTPFAIQMTMLAKSITTPLAMEATEQVHGVPALAAVFVITTGIVGAVLAPAVYRLLAVTLPQAQGVALGSVCHAIGTAKALHMGEKTGALATLGLCLNGIMTAIVLPLLFA